MMKNIANSILLTLAGLFILTNACNKDNVTSCSGKGLVSKSTMFFEGSIVRESKYYYDNDSNLIRYSIENFGNKYNYVISYDIEGQGISKISNSNDGKESSNLIYIWKKDTLFTENKRIIDSEQAMLILDTLVFNADKQVVRWSRYGVVDGVSWSMMNLSSKWENENIVNYEFYQSSSNETYTYEYEYDDKKHPHNSYYRDYLVFKTKNNVTKLIRKDIEGKIVNAVSYEYEYNDYGYPTKKTVISEKPFSMYDVEFYEYGCN